MKKQTLEIYRYTGLPRGYDYTGNDAPSLEDIMNKIMEFSDKKKVKIYKHFIRKEWIEDKKYPPRIIGNDKIPRGDSIWYLDIYYQEE